MSRHCGGSASWSTRIDQVGGGSGQPMTCHRTAQRPSSPPRRGSTNCLKGNHMNDVLVRPQTKFAAALLAAGVVSAASIVGVPEIRDLPTITADVANASVITDWLRNFGDAVQGVASGVALPFEGAIALPFDAAAAIAAAAQNPSLSPNVLSWLIQRYVNPSDGSGQFTYPSGIKFYSIERLAGLLPYPLGLNVIDAVNQIADAIGGALSGLPDPGPG